MAQTTISHLYPFYDEAVQAVADLQAAGVPATDIDLIESEADARLPAAVAEDAAQPPAATGATIGAGIGGGLGALIGIGAISVSFLQPLAQTGWLVPTVIGAAIGAGIGALIGLVTKVGVTSQHAHSVAEGLQRGQCLVMVRLDESVAAQAEALLRRARAVPLAAPPSGTVGGEAEAVWEDSAELEPASGPREGPQRR
ncbi:MAG: DUF1269 domain-containing protein [Acetobacteraceae bacterium]